jgi:hypothetical protein
MPGPARVLPGAILISAAAKALVGAAAKATAASVMARVKDFNKIMVQSLST